MKILKVIHGYPPTYNAGSEIYSQSICEELAKDNEVQVFTREQNDYELDFVIRQEVQNNVRLHFVNLAREKDGYEHELVNRSFEKILGSFQPDVLHVGHLNHLSLGVIRVAYKRSIPIIFTLHDFWLMCPRGQFLQRNFDGEKLYQLCDGQEDGKCATNCYSMLHSCAAKDKVEDIAYWTKWVNRRMQAVRSLIPMIHQFIAPSQYLKNRFLQDFPLPKEKILYLDYGFPTHYLSPAKKKKNSIFTFSYIGTHIPAKGVNLLIEAFKKLEGKSQLIIWGRTAGQNTAALKKLTKKSLSPIIFKGEYVNQNIVSEVFSETDVIVVPSIWGENSPLVIHEAQACHIPVITADFGGMKEYVAHQTNGLLFEHRNIEDLAKQMQWAMEHPVQMKEYGQRGYLHSKDGKIISLTDHCQKLKQVYQQAISENETRK